MKKTVLAMIMTLLASPAWPDTLIEHANGIEIDAEGHLSRFTGILITDEGKVARLIGPGEALPGAGVKIDAHGQTVLPGMIDAHGHVMELGRDALQLDVVGVRSLGELQQRLRSYAAAHPDYKWLLGAGWNQELWPDKRFPTAADLDAIVPDRPVVLERVDGHALVANSAAMRAAGVTSATTAPAGGEIINGVFVDNAKVLINRAVPLPTRADEDRQFAKAQEILLGFGVTGVGSMSTSLDDWNTFRRSGEAGSLRVRLMVYLLGLDPLKAIPHPTSWLYGDHLRAVGVKFFADGALGSRGAWLKQPYSDQPDTTGNRLHSNAELRSIENAAAAAGFQIATHAIGDAANAQVIGNYEWLNGKYGANRRWRIEHAQIVDCSDLPRIGRGHMIASMQPTHQTSDRLMAEKRLGLGRLKCAYAWQSMLRTGAKLAFGTDFPVESPNPFPGLAAGISRQDMNGEPPGGWFPSERLSLGQALAAYTRGAAYAGFAEHRIGGLDPGQWADFIIVDRDPTKVDPQQLARTKVLETWVGGKKVWGREVTSDSQALHGQ
ncbi:MAG TPA: amidohydrolase family protein [Sphingomicrobium sp.]|nr:amidohydrolase family protein [Sphingomicrobium sp.]